MASKKNTKINGGFIIQPKRTIRSKQWKALTVYDREVYRALLTEFIRDKTLNPDNEVCITQIQIMELTGISEAEVKRCIKRLKDSGFIQFKQKGGLARRYSVYILSGRYLW